MQGTACIVYVCKNRWVDQFTKPVPIDGRPRVYAAHRPSVRKIIR